MRQARRVVGAPRWAPGLGGGLAALALLAALLVGPWSPAAGQASVPSFAAAANFGVGTGPDSVAVADVNGDGRPDLLVANFGTNNVSVLLNTTAPGAAVPTFAAATNFGAGTGPESVAVADVNGDGRPDLLVANQTSGNVSVLLNTTAPGAAVPTFAAVANFGVGSSPRSVVAADVNGDGRPDLLVANFGSDTVSVRLNTTPPGAAVPTFAAAANFAVGSSPISVAAADVNGDGRPDLLVADAGSDSVSVLLNTTTPGAVVPTFAAATNFGAGTGPFSVAAADVNGDGRPDLLVANFGSGNVSVRLNTTAPGAVVPTFTAATNFGTGTNPFSVAAADVNGDGRPDLLVANQSSNNVSVLLNTTAPGAAVPAFAAATNFAAGTGPLSVAVEDMNGDGRPDLLVANQSSNNVSVLLNTTSPFGRGGAFFVGPTNFGTGTIPFFVAAADVNGDGRPDLLVANFSTDDVSVLLNTTAPGAAAPSFAPATNFAAGTSPRSVAAADVNGDGRPDLLVASQGTNSVLVLLNTTAPGAVVPTFAAAASFAAGTSPWSVAAADVNGDGRPDLLVANQTSGNVSVLLSTTAPGAVVPSFAPATNFAVGTIPRSLVAADVNGDGRPDLLVANSGSTTVSVLLNTTTPGAAVPSFAAATNFAAGTGPESVAAADVNGDGRPDLLVANFGTTTVSVLLNTTAPGAAVPSFAAATSFGASGSPISVAAADVNGDGRPDLLVANNGSNNVSVLLNTTAPGAVVPSFAAATNFAAGSAPSSVAAADVNGDGRPDLLVANAVSNNVSVLLNAGCILGDINCDGIVDVRDYGIWRTNFGQTDCGNPADLDGICIVDIRDYGIWRANFGHTAGAAALDDASPALLTPGPATPTPTRTVVASAAALVTPTATLTPPPPSIPACPLDASGASRGRRH